MKKLLGGDLATRTSLLVMISTGLISQVFELGKLKHKIILLMKISE